MFRFLSQTNHLTRRSGNGPRNRRLAVQALEPRAMFAGIPQLSSLPGATHTLYLDFDGHFQASWNRTDSDQTYTNINVGEFNIDGTAGISTSEESAIRKIWETVADDYAPFNVNVTTVAPAGTANFLRVVMAGTSNATLLNSLGTTVNIPTRDVFISDDNGTMVDTSGYASVGSYSDAEPNVVFVFARYMSTWGTTDTEGRYRDLRLIIATTASHEAGHAYGLEHHGDYDTGTSLITPIMGANTQGDRSLWSTYTVGSTTVDSKAHLASLLGARPDEFGGSLYSASQFPMGYSPIYGVTGTARGVIGTTSDLDLFRLTTSAKNTYQFSVTVPQFGNLDAQIVLYVVRGWSGYEYLEQAAVFDAAIPQSSPYSGLGVTITSELPAGKYAIGVRSHGGYGDIGGYALTISIPSTRIYVDLGLVGMYDAGPTPPPKPPRVDNSATKSLATLAMATTSGGSGTETTTTKPNSTALIDDSAGQRRIRKRDEPSAREQVFAQWPTKLLPFAIA